MADGRAARGPAKQPAQQRQKKKQKQKKKTNQQQQERGSSRFACGRCGRVYFHVASCQRHARTCGSTVRFPCSCTHAPFASFEALRIHARRMKHDIPEETHQRNKELVASSGPRGRRKPRIVELPPDPKLQPQPQPQARAQSDMVPFCSAGTAGSAGSVPPTPATASNLATAPAPHKCTLEATTNTGTQTVTPQPMQRPLPLQDVGFQVGQTCAITTSTSTISVQHGASVTAHCISCSAQTQTNEEVVMRDGGTQASPFEQQPMLPSSIPPCSVSPAMCSATCQTEFTRDKSVPLLHLVPPPPPPPPTTTAQGRRGDAGSTYRNNNTTTSRNSITNMMPDPVSSLTPLPLHSGSQSPTATDACVQTGSFPAAPTKDGTTDSWVSAGPSAFSFDDSYTDGERAALYWSYGTDADGNHTETMERATSPLFHTVGTDCSELFQDIGTDCDGLLSSDVGTDCFDLLFSS